MAHSAYEKLDRPVDSEDEDSNADESTIPRSSEDVRRHDRDTLHAEEEAEGLLGWEEKAERRQRRLGRKQKRRSEVKEEREIMYAMEEGEKSETSSNSSEVDLNRWKALQGRTKKSKTSRFLQFTSIHLLILAAFLALLFGAYKASSSHGQTSSSRTTYTPQTLSNGTHTFSPTTLLISLDGFRADFLHRDLTPALDAFVRAGVSPKYMKPSFPSLTFPNHFTLVTGLHPESHGIVGNSFYDPSLEEEFDYGHLERSMQAKWWLAEPLWTAAERAGMRSAIHMWPGSEAGLGAAEGVEPMVVDAFQQDEELGVKVNRILGWLDLPGREDEGFKSEEEGKERPQFIAAYVPDVDADGHLYGPNSTYIRSTIAEVDGMLGALFAGIEERNLTDIVNVMIVSDHGMATTSTQRLVQLEDLIDTSTVAHTDGWPLYGLRLKDTSESKLIETYNTLLAHSKKPQYHHAFDVYLRDENMPERYHFENNERIAPLWIVPKPGWAIVRKHEFDVEVGKAQGLVYHPRGLHGYDNEHPLMRAIYAARGPAFPHEEGSEVEVFQNTEVYNIVCDSLGIEPKANNGSLRLPLKTIGSHDFEAMPQPVQDLPGNEADEVDNTVPFLPPIVPNLASPNEQGIAATTQGAAVSWEEGSSVDMPETTGTQEVVPVNPTRPVVEGDQAKPTRPVVHDGQEGDEEEEEEEEGDRNMWWQWVKGKLDAIKGWAYSFGVEEGGEGGGDGR